MVGIVGTGRIGRKRSEKVGNSGRKWSERSEKVGPGGWGDLFASVAARMQIFKIIILIKIVKFS